MVPAGSPPAPTATSGSRHGNRIQIGSHDGFGHRGVSNPDDRELARGRSPQAAHGSLWFTERFGNKIGRITTAGVITEFAVPSNESEPFGIAAGPDGDIWFTEIARNQIGRIGPVFSRVLDLSVGPDGGTRLLRLDGSSGQVALDSVNGDGAVSRGSGFGPYQGWTARRASAGSDGLTRVLWTNDDGSAALWLVGPDGNQASFRLGPAAGWRAIDVAASVPGTTHLLWTDADGRIALWAVENSGRVSTGPAYGPYAGWTAAAIADGEDGLSRVLWNRFDGASAISLFGPDGLLASYPFGPVAGWTAADIAVGADLQTRILWTHQDRRMALWRVDAAGNPTALGPVYEPPAGFTASRVAAGSDGRTRVLWTDASGAAVVWVLSWPSEEKGDL